MKYIILLCTVLSAACASRESVITVSSRDSKAESVFLTRDHEDRPVVAWLENIEGKYVLSAAISYDYGETFKNKFQLPLTADVATHAESMPKVAFAGDGTIFAAYEKKTPTTENKYASSIFYVVSTDNGTSWTKEKFVHSDTMKGRSRSYFDIERLPDGTVGAAWLDIKLNQETGGRSVRFARTSSAHQFTNEVLIDSSACQCCRIDVHASQKKDVYISYRGLKKGPMGKQIRDMMIASSSDGGSTFSRPLLISADNWNIDGCPHTGPSICSNKAGLISLWYTEGTGTGIFYSETLGQSTTFQPKTVISSTGRHPQLCANGDRIAMLWEENISSGETNVTVIHHRLLNNGGDIGSGALTAPDGNAYSPVITAIANTFLVAFLKEDKGNCVVQVKKI